MTIEELEAKLETVTRERDLSLSAWESVGMTGRTAQSAMLELARQLEEARAEIATLTAALDERDVEAERGLEQYDRLTRERDRLREQVVTVNNNIETFQKETWRYRHERDEALAEIAEWKRVTGYDDTETLDFECGRAGIRTHIDVVSRLRETANRERDEARAEVARLRREVDEMAAELHALSVKYDANVNGSADAYIRGAEAMREACASAMHPIMRSMISRTEAAQTIRALPIPEEP